MAKLLAEPCVGLFGDRHAHRCLSHGKQLRCTSHLEVVYLVILYVLFMEKVIVNLQPGENVEWHGLLVMLQVLADYLYTILAVVFGLLFFVLRSQR